jgi:8-amino-7-oxononanoate synthase
VTIPLRRADDVSVATVFRDLFEVGVFVNPVIPPAVTGEAGLIRLSLMVDHDAALLEEASELLYKVIDEHDQL